MNERVTDDQIVIDFYKGAYGPTIRIDVQSVKNLLKIKDTFLMLATAKIRQINFNQIGKVKVAGMASLTLRSVSESSPPEKNLILMNTPVGLTFDWLNCPKGWDRCSGLLDGLIEHNSSGHQYLTNETVDDALVEVAFLE